jgi:hypothetical protein
MFFNYQEPAYSQNESGWYAITLKNTIRRRSEPETTLSGKAISKFYRDSYA